jgi:hypothetical protein
MPEENIYPNNTYSAYKVTIDDLYPELSPDDRAEAEFHLLGYLDVVRRIFERICREQPELLTELEKTASLKQEKPVE